MFGITKQTEKYRSNFKYAFQKKFIIRCFLFHVTKKKFEPKTAIIGNDKKKLFKTFHKRHSYSANKINRHLVCTIKNIPTDVASHHYSSAGSQFEQYKKTICQISHQHLFKQRSTDRFAQAWI